MFTDSSALFEQSARRRTLPREPLQPPQRLAALGLVRHREARHVPQAAGGRLADVVANSEGADVGADLLEATRELEQLE